MVLRVALTTLVAVVLLSCTETSTTVQGERAGTDAVAITASDEDIASLARDFETIAFYRSETALNSTPVRWTPISEPARVSVSVEDFMTPAQKRASRERASRAIESLKSAGVDIAEASSPATFTIINTDQRYYAELATSIESVAAPVVTQQFLMALRTDGCAFLPVERGSKHVGGFLFVDVQHSESDQTNCVVVGLANAVGFRGSLSSGATAFSSTMPAVGFSERDLDLVRMGYDPRLRPGMSLAEARPLFPAIAADVLAR